MMLKFLNLFFIYTVADTRATCCNFQSQVEKIRKFLKDKFFYGLYTPG